jgi:hypothetical protein
MKCVRFQDFQSTSRHHEDDCWENISQESDENLSWYSHQDNQRFKNQSKLISKELRLLGRDRILQGTFPSPDDSVFDSEQAQSKLIQWTGNVGMGRGLERWICPIHGLQRTRERRKATLAVLRVQALMLSRVDNDVFVEQIRLISEPCTEEAKRFARSMGIADEVAASRCHALHSPITILYNR